MLLCGRKVELRQELKRLIGLQTTSFGIAPGKVRFIGFSFAMQMRHCANQMTHVFECIFVYAFRGRNAKFHVYLEC